MEHFIKLVAGDWSGDGHCQTTVKTFKSNVPAEELRAAYRAAVNLVGVDLDDICMEYEDGTYCGIKEDTIRQINGHIPNQFEDFEGGSISITPDDFFSLWIAFAKYGNHDIVLEEINGDVIDIGGYGLYPY